MAHLPTLKRYAGNPILSKNPQHVWEAGSVLNPGVLFDNGIFRMVYRATNDIKIDVDGSYTSSIGYAESVDGIHFTPSAEPLISPDQDYELNGGCEDPRVTKIGDTYFLYYTACRVINGEWTVRVALATSKDFKHWQKHGIVGPATKSKAACLLPEKINGQYVMFFTWMPDSPSSSIMQVRFDSLDEVVAPPVGLVADSLNTYDQNVVFAPPLNVYRGAEVGAVPIKTEAGWLFIYCNANVSGHSEWTISAALLDLKDPRIVLATTERPILAPETEEERNGIVKNVVFPEGAVVVSGELYVYYGSGDQGICLATCPMAGLMQYLVAQTG